MNLFEHRVRILGRGISRTQSLYLSIQDTTQKNADTSMLRAGFEPAIPVFERSKTVRTLTARSLGPAGGNKC